ncbi:hypothetical protein [uncultured Methanomethylovorans sp.]|uniref:hypothetical protein n=1 Tax=uncultured Methanomethylovorans sp. TaxID=183759 RepID=UPI002AA9159D|nr:hypothetical protein [uncultured Methanomethylovorans sp.]
MDRKSILFAAVLIIYLVLQQHPVTASSTDANDTEWLTPSEFTIYWGEQAEIDGYTITALDFSASKPVDLPDDYVMLSIKSNTSRSWSAILALNNSVIPNETILDGLVKLTAKDVVTGNDIPTPYATIEIAIANSSSISKPIPWINSVLRVKRLPAKEAYIDERVYILTEVINLKEIPLENIHINETVPDGFITDPDVENTCWTINLQPRDKRSIGYSIRALKPGTFLIPSMKLSLEYNGITHRIKTNSSEIVIHGPCIDVNKSFLYQNTRTEGLLNITLQVNNSGDRAAYVQLTDQIPEGSILMNGNLSKSQVMQPSDIWTLEYSLSINSSKNIVIPGAKVRFVDSRGYEDSFESAGQILKIEENIVEETLSDEELSQEEIPQEIENDTEETIVQENKTSEKISSVSSLKQSIMNIIEKAIGWRL